MNTWIIKGLLMRFSSLNWHVGALSLMGMTCRYLYIFYFFWSQLTASGPRPVTKSGMLRNRNHQGMAKTAPWQHGKFGCLQDSCTDIPTWSCQYILLRTWSLFACKYIHKMIEFWLKGKFELNRSGSVIWLTKWKRTESVDVWFDELSLRWVTLVNKTGVCNSASF